MKILWLTTREKILLGVLALIALALAFYFFAFRPRLAELTVLAETDTALAIQIEEADRGLAQLPLLAGDMTIADMSLQQAEQDYFWELNQETIILLLNGLFLDTGITDSSLSFSALTNEPMGEAFSEHYRRTMLVSVACDAAYDQLVHFLETVENYEKKIRIENISLSAPGSDQHCRASITLEFISYSPFDLSKLVPTPGEPNPTNSWSDPFAVQPEESTDEPETPPTADARSLPVDFFVSANPFVSDTPSVIAGRSQDPTHDTYIYENSNAVETVDFFLSEWDGALYYRYQALESRYPADGGTARFVPQDDVLRIRALSAARLSADDLSGIDLHITNTTGMNVEVLITGDDENDPRVTVSGDENVTVVRE